MDTVKIDRVSKEIAARGPFHLLKHWIGLDRAIFFTIAARLSQAVSTLITMFLIARLLTAREQGYYYTFYSMVALNIIFELGFSFVILQLAAHERAHLTFLPGGTIQGDPVAHSRLASVFQKAVRWYIVAGVLMAVSLAPAGYFFFLAHPTPGSAVAWKAPWFALIAASMLAFQIDPVFSFLEGCGFVAQVAQRRLVQSIFGFTLAWIALVLHHGLFAPALIIAGQVVIGLAYVFSSRHRPFLGGLMRYPVREHFVGWRKEILPFQWKIAVSFLSGFFIYQIFNPVLFAYQGAEAAGRMGMSISVTNGIGFIAAAWINTKAAPFGTMVARRDFKQLDRLFYRTAIQSTALLIFGDSLFLFLLSNFGHYLPRYANRMLPLWTMGILMINMALNHIVCCQALYLRVFKREPFFIQAVISALLITTTTFICGKYYGANALVVVLLFLSVFWGIPSATYIFMTRRKRYRAERSGVALERIMPEEV